MVRTSSFHDEKMGSSPVGGNLKSMITTKLLISFTAEIYLSIMILTQLLFISFLVPDKSKNFPCFDREMLFQTLLILVGCFYILCQCNLSIETSLLANDLGTLMLKRIIAFFSLPLIIVLGRAYILQTISFGEVFVILLISFLGSFLLVSSCDFVTAYLSLEMQALSFYVLCSFKKASAYSTDSGLKYFVLGSFVSCLYLMGCLLVYGSLGTLNFNALVILLSLPLESYSTEVKSFAFLGVSLMLMSLLFKVAAAPFHFWAPDVYEGAPLCSTIGISILPKIALFYFSLNFVNIFGTNFSIIFDLLSVSGLCTVFTGTYLALIQTRLKRFMIYSSVAQTGFFVMALGYGNYGGFCALFFFIIVYVTSSILFWAFIVEFYSSQFDVNCFYLKPLHPVYMSTASNLYSKAKVAGTTFLVVLLSVGGMPPSAGFLSKVFVLREAIGLGFELMAVAVVLISAVSFYYYLRLVKISFFEIEVTKKNRRVFQSFFKSSLSDSIFSVIVIGSFVLYLSFFIPEYILLYVELIILGTGSY